MPRCPDTIDGAVVILAVVLDLERHRHSGSTRLYADSEQTWFHGLAIARYGRDSNDGDVYLFYCDESWETENDCCYSTIEEAVAEASRQFRFRGMIGNVFRGHSTKYRTQAAFLLVPYSMAAAPSYLHSTLRTITHGSLAVAPRTPPRV